MTNTAGNANQPGFDPANNGSTPPVDFTLTSGNGTNSAAQQQTPSDAFQQPTTGANPFGQQNNAWNGGFGQQSAPGAAGGFNQQTPNTPGGFNQQTWQQPQAGPNQQYQPQWNQPTGLFPVAPMNPGEERTAAILIHLLGPIGALVSAGLLSILGPLIAYFIYRDRSRYVAWHAAQAFNFQMTLFIISVACWILTLTIILAVITIPLLLLSCLASVIFGIVAAYKVGNNEDYKYPFALNILKF